MNASFFFSTVVSALETILINSAYAEIYGLVQSECRQDDSKINKHVQNAIAVNVRPADLGLEHPALIRSLNKARLELIKLAAQKTPLEKIRHVKNCLKILSSSGSEEELRPVSTDDLLPAIILILVKSGLRDLATQFHFLSDLRFSSAGPQDEDAFVVATFEAALEHVKSGRLETDSSRYTELKITSPKKYMAGNARDQLNDAGKKYLRV